MKKTNNLNQGVLAKHKDLFLGLFVVCAIAVLSVFGNTEWFRASIVKIPEKFNGTVRPIEKVPDWFNWGGDNKTTKYSIIPESKLIEMPSYLISVGGENVAEMIEESQEKLAKLTYAVVYLGNYNVLQRKEYTGSHPAVDIRVPVGTPILSVANGKIVKVVKGDTGFGNHIVVEMQNVPDYPDSSKTETFYASYSHLSEVLVQDGDIVRKGQIIGKSGNSGTSTTPHLHFQIDRKEVKWFPYWPFTSNEVYAANLNFFSAIRNGFKQENAIANTINPMRWVEANLDGEYNGNTNIAGDEFNFSNFKIIAANQFATNGRLALTIITEDEKGRIITDFKSSTDIEISSSSTFARFSKTLRFKDGIATVMITNPKEEEFTFEIKYKGLSFKKQITVVMPESEKTEEKEVASEVISNKEQIVSVSNEKIELEEKPEVEIEEKKEAIKVEEKKQEIKEVIPDEAWEIDNNVKVLFSGNNEIEAGSKLNIDIFINNLDGTFADVIRDYAIDVAGVGKLNQYLLRKNDFVGSKARVQFISEKVGNSIINLNGVDFEVKIIEKKQPEVKEVVIEKDTVVSSDVNNDATIKNETNNDSLEQNELDTNEKPIIGPEIKEKVIDEEIFNDVSKNHKNYDAIKYLKEMGVIGGYDDGTFKPSKIVSRVEAVKMIFKALKISSNGSSSLPFKDTDNGAWYAEFVGAALQRGIVKGYDDGTFKPAREVNRAEYYKILLLSAGVEITQTNNDPYLDVPASTWFGTYINYVKENKLSDASGNFFPSNGVSRAEVAESIYRLVKILL